MQLFLLDSRLPEADKTPVLLEDYQPTLAKLGIKYGSWPIPEALKHNGKSLLEDSNIQNTCLEMISEELSAFKQRFGYQSQDIVGLSPKIANLQAILSQFEREHHHTDDEVRVVLYGKGLFAFVFDQATEKKPLAMVLEPGDWIVIPSYTRHWFTLDAQDPEQTVIALRIFKENPSWEAIYEPLLADGALPR